MKSHTPAEGILIHRDYGDAKHYTISCECCGSDCEHRVWVESDETGVTVSTYTKQKSQWWKFNCLQIIWKLLIKGYVEYEAGIIMTKQQALNYAETLKKSVKDVEEFRRNHSEKRVRKTTL